MTRTTPPKPPKPPRPHTPPPPAGPSTPPPPAAPRTPPPSGPRRKIDALDPNTAAGRAAAEEMSRVLAEIQVAIWQRKSERRRKELTA